MTTVLYRIYRRSDGRLVYCGVSSDLPRRLAEHKRTAAWWPDDARLVVRSYASRAEALDAERQAIAQEWPLANARSPWVT